MELSSSQPTTVPAPSEPPTYSHALYEVVIPTGVAAGQTFTTLINGEPFITTVPEGFAAGDRMRIPGPTEPSKAASVNIDVTTNNPKFPTTSANRANLSSRQQLGLSVCGAIISVMSFSLLLVAVIAPYWVSFSLGSGDVTNHFGLWEQCEEDMYLALHCEPIPSDFVNFTFWVVRTCTIFGILFAFPGIPLKAMAAYNYSRNPNAPKVEVGTFKMDFTLVAASTDGLAAFNVLVAWIAWSVETSSEFNFDTASSGASYFLMIFTFFFSLGAAALDMIVVQSNKPRIYY